MSRHRRQRVIGRARSTVIKTAAAMGVATAIAAGAHSVADSPVQAQASSEPRDETLETSEDQLATAQDTAHAQTPADGPSDLATDAARAPQAIQAASHHVVVGRAGAGHAQQHASGAVAQAPSTGHTAPSAPASTDTPGTPAPSQSSSSQSPSSPPPPASSGDSQSDQGGLLTGVVDGVGGVLGGLLG